VTQEPSFKFFPDLREIHGRVTRRTARQTMPEIPAIQKQEAQPIGETVVFSRLRWGSIQIAPMQRFQFWSLLLLSALDQFT
jgi:hypothetical protein